MFPDLFDGLTSYVMLPLLILPFVGLDLLLAKSRRRRSRSMRPAA